MTRVENRFSEVWELPDPEKYSELVSSVRAGVPNARSQMTVHVTPMIEFMQRFEVGKVKLPPEILENLYGGSGELEHYLELAAYLCPAEMCELLRAAATAYAKSSDDDSSVLSGAYSEIETYLSQICNKIPAAGIEFMSVDIDESLVEVALTNLLQLMKASAV